MLERLARLALVLALLPFAAVSADAPNDAEGRMVTLDGHQVRVRFTEPPTTGAPTVVFVNGGVGRFESWDKVQPVIARDAATFTYDRSGNGKSESGTQRPTLPQNAAEQRAVLAQVGLKPPYVLVGHSYGAAIAREYAAAYPSEGAALVFVDPVDFVLTKEERNRPEARAAYAALDHAQAQSTAGAPEKMQASIVEITKNMLEGFPDLSAAKSLPDIPVYILLGGQRQPLPKGVEFPDYEHAFELFAKDRLIHMYALSRQVTHGWLTVTPESSHYIQLIQPDLVVAAIRQVAGTNRQPPHKDSP